jgi:hypothetical protein
LVNTAQRENICPRNRDVGGRDGDYGRIYATSAYQILPTADASAPSVPDRHAASWLPGTIRMWCVDLKLQGSGINTKTTIVIRRYRRDRLAVRAGMVTFHATQEVPTRRAGMAGAGVTSPTIGVASERADTEGGKHATADRSSQNGQRGVNGVYSRKHLLWRQESDIAYLMNPGPFSPVWTVHRSVGESP